MAKRFYETEVDSSQERLARQTYSPTRASTTGGVGTTVGVPNYARYQQKNNQGTKKTGSYTVNAGNQPYVDMMNSLYGQIVGRGPFQYDLQSDMRYKQMADQYTTKGQQAMMDTMGQAAALTGGYGNSYAQGVGNQAYQQYLMALNEQVPSLYQQAYNVWQDEGDRLLQLYNFVAQHPGTVEALSPKTYTYTVEDDAAGVDQSYQQLAQDLLKNNTTQEQAPSNALLNWYYQLLNT